MPLLAMNASAVRSADSFQRRQDALWSQSGAAIRRGLGDGWSYADNTSDDLVDGVKEAALPRLGAPTRGE